MRIHIIACQVFFRELSYYAATCKNIIDITWLPQGLHNTPDILVKKIQETINEIEQLDRNKPDVIALGYGLCSNGVVGLKAKSIPIIIPKTDDCIALFLGSQERYLKNFHKYNPTYWLNSGWIERAHIPSSEEYEVMRETYIEQFGEDNAEFLLEMDKQWIKNYKYSGYIESKVYNAEENIEKAKKAAEENGWEFVALEGDDTMFKHLVDGEWDEKEFLLCPVGFEVAASFDKHKVKAVRIEEDDEF